MSYKPPRPEERTGRSAVGPHQHGVLVTVFKVLLGLTVSITLVALFLASAALAWVVLFTGPEIEIRPADGGGVTIAVPGARPAPVTRLRLAGQDGQVIWEFASRDGGMTLPPIRLRPGPNPVDPGLGDGATIVSPLATTFALDGALEYALTVWGPNEAGGRGSTTLRFRLTEAHGGDRIL